MLIEMHLGKMFNLTVVLLLATLTAAGAPGDDASARAKLAGTWQPQESAATGVWTFEHKEGNVIHVTYSLGNQKVMDFECSTTGKDCEVKDAGKSAKASMWYSGSKLVELETKGAEVVKRRFAVAPEGDSLEVEVIPIQPDGKTETLHFRRLPQ